MKPINDINKIFIALFSTMVLLGVPVAAYAAWPDVGMHPVAAANFSPSPRQLPQHQVRMNVAPPVRVEVQHRLPPAQGIVYSTPPMVRRPQVPRTQPPINHPETVLRHETQTPHSYRDLNFVKHFDEHFFYISASPATVVPDDLEEVVVDGQTYFYSEGVFYQQEGDQLVAIGAVVGAVVDYLPPDYQMVMADGINYFVWGGVYYQRLAEGFEVVVPPDA